MQRLRQRADFIAAAAGVKAPRAAFVLQSRERGDEEPPRVGFTVTKKIGTAVERNRVRRRLRDVVRRSAAERLRAGRDYVLVARRAALEEPFDRLMRDFLGALAHVHRGRSARKTMSEPAREPSGGAPAAESTR